MTPADDATNTLNTDYRAELIEAVMRLTSDDLLLLGFLNPYADPRKVLGSFLAQIDSDRLPLGTPLRRWAYGEAVNPQWRSSSPALQGSLWEQYQTLIELCGEIEDATDPYDAMCKLLERANQRIASDS
jgi:hypothetical protein